MPETVTVTTQLLQAPLPTIVEQLGVSIAKAQFALDKNSIELAKELAATEIEVGDEQYSLLTLGFVPSFYAFTEATVEARLSFSMTETTEFSIDVGVDAGVNVGVAMVAVSVDVAYARKFSVSSEGQSSLAARLVSLPPPDGLLELMRSHRPST
ncbi:hypothetical protein CFK38_04150 [Brachybacterium vulturis]|uniref:Uncharacterized protein n=1 Tax=Brachybacterium vulturis TaxID=2017484 RepID=A0A291GL93_9MICO|nr:hypothetical protein [Brachybacterium vulturis]ATG50806.1 hypothetical protein CFK38_04150 [Brachybacterium vulturis]